MDIWDALRLHSKAGWDPSWAANNDEEVATAHQCLVAALQRLEALEAIARQVATSKSYLHHPDLCPFCDEPWFDDDTLEHTADCPVTQARDLTQE